MSALGGQYPPDDALTVIFKLVGGEPGPGGRITLQQEAGTHLGLVAARAHHAGFGALPRQSPRASMAMDLPAPVSPGDAGHPGCRSSSRNLTMAKLLTVSWVSMVSSCMGQHYCVCIQYILVLYTVKWAGRTFAKQGRARMSRPRHGCDADQMALQNQPAYLAWAEAMREATLRGSLVVSGWHETHSETVLVEPGCTDLFARMRQDDPYPNPCC